MRKTILVILLLLCGVSVYSQSTPAKKPATPASTASTTVNLSIDQYDWNKLIVSHNFDKENTINVQFWYKTPTAAKRLRVFYQRKFTYSKDKSTVVFIPGIGLQGTSRKRNSISYQIITPVELQYRYKFNKNWTFNSRISNTLSLSPRASQGDHTSKTITDAGFKYQKTAVFYRAEYLSGFKAGLRENFQGGGATYDLTKKLTIGGILYTNFKESKQRLHFAITTSIKF